MTDNPSRNLNDDAAGFSLRRMSVFEKGLCASLLLFVVTIALAAAILASAEARLALDLKNEAARRLNTVQLIAREMLADEEVSAAEAERFNALSLASLVVNSDNTVVLSSFTNEGWKAGAQFVPDDDASVELPVQARRPISISLEDDNLVWFFWDSRLKSYLGVGLQAQPLANTLARLRLLLLLLVGAVLGLNVWVVWRLIVGEVSTPARGLSRLLAELADTGELGEAEESIKRLRATWEPNPRHELQPLLRSAERLVSRSRQLSDLLRAMADDRNLEQPTAPPRGDLELQAHRLRRFLLAAAEGLDHIADGNFEAELAETLRADGRVGQSFHRMHQGVQILLERLSQASDHLRSSASSLKASSSAQASAASKQAAGVTETMATMEELAASSGHIADTAKHVVAIAEQTLENAREGQDAVENVGEGMEDIVNASLRGSKRLLNLDEKSRSIGKVATLIAGVAEKSKILALNAAIEAAHAGEAGRGFSVVAEEVRNLADSIFASTREIDDLINEIQVEIRQAVQASDEEVKRANKGRDLAQNAQSTIVQIFSSAENMTRAAHQIELATNQQRSASGQVATAVREMAASADDVATGAKSVLSSLDGLGNLAEDLQHILRHFEEVQLPSSSARSESTRGAAEAETPTQD